jgi:hypothetical protein
MLWLLIRALLSGAIVTAVAFVAKRSPSVGGLIASLPLISVLGMIWLWHDTHDNARMAEHARSTFWFVLPSLPMFLLIPALLRRGHNFYGALLAGCVLTMLLYALMLWVAPRLGLRL